MIYKVKNNESISDVCLNSTGSLTSWETIVSGFDTWTPELYNGQLLEVPNVINNISKEQLDIYPLSNFSVFNLNSLISDFVSTFESVVITEFNIPVVKESSPYYLVKEGDTITDVVLNATGDLINWQLYTTDTWVPKLNPGQKIPIIYDTQQKNVLQQLFQFPLCNNPGINNLDEQINELISNFDENLWILKSGFWDDSLFWIDSAYWID